MDRLLFSLSFLGPEIVRETGVCVCVGGGGGSVEAEPVSPVSQTLNTRFKLRRKTELFSFPINSYSDIYDVPFYQIRLCDIDMRYSNRR